MTRTLAKYVANFALGGVLACVTYYAMVTISERKCQDAWIEAIREEGKTDPTARDLFPELFE